MKIRTRSGPPVESWRDLSVVDSRLLVDPNTFEAYAMVRVRVSLNRDEQIGVDPNGAATARKIVENQLIK